VILKHGKKLKKSVTKSWGEQKLGRVIGAPEGTWGPGGDLGSWWGTLGPIWECGDPKSCAIAILEKRCAQVHYILKMFPGRL